MTVYESFFNDPRVLRDVSALSVSQAATGLEAGPLRSLNSTSRQQGGVITDTTALRTFLGIGVPALRCFYADSGAIRPLLSTGTQPINGIVADAGPLRSLSSTARLIGSTALLGPILTDPSLVAITDYDAIVSGIPSRYVVDLVAADDSTTRLQISSWQATLQTTQKSYGQCVVPAVTGAISTALNAAVDFVILRLAIVDTGIIEQEMVRCPLQSVSYAQGAFNHSATLQGYVAGFVEVADPPAYLDRELTDVQIVFVYEDSVRVRCAIDWHLRPQQRAIVDGSPLIVSSISYYVGGNQAYMDVVGS